MAFDYHPINLPPPRGVGAGLNFIADLKAKEALNYQQAALQQQNELVRFGMGEFGKVTGNIYDRQNDERTAARQRERDTDIFNRQTSRDTTNYERESDDNLFKVTGGYRREDIQDRADSGHVSFGAMARQLIGEREFKEQQDKINLYREQHDYTNDLTEQRQDKRALAADVAKIRIAVRNGTMTPEAGEQAEAEVRETYAGIYGGGAPPPNPQAQSIEAGGQIFDLKEKLTPNGQVVLNRILQDSHAIDADPVLKSSPQDYELARTQVQQRMAALINTPEYRAKPPPTPDELLAKTTTRNPVTGARLGYDAKNGKAYEVEKGVSLTGHAEIEREIRAAQTAAMKEGIPFDYEAELMRSGDAHMRLHQREVVYLTTGQIPPLPGEDLAPAPPFSTPQGADDFLQRTIAGVKFKNQDREMERAFNLIEVKTPDIRERYRANQEVERAKAAGGPPQMAVPQPPMNGNGKRFAAPPESAAPQPQDDALKQIRAAVLQIKADIEANRGNATPEQKAQLKQLGEQYKAAGGK